MTIYKGINDMNCAEYLVDFLIQKGVTDIFGYSGGYIVPFIDALYTRRDEINVHVCYNEQGCAFAANGYARVSDKFAGQVSLDDFRGANQNDLEMNDRNEQKEEMH